MFFGYQRSGHSFVSSLIDAHRDAVVSDEFHVLMKFKKWGWDKDKLFQGILKNSLRKTVENRARKFQYLRENEYQGTYKDNLKLIGDKKGGKTSIFLTKNPDLLTKFQNEIDLPIKFIHVIRNPFDMITTTKFRLEKKDNRKKSLNSIISSFEIMFRKANKIRKYNIDFIDVYHENVIKKPDSEIKRMLDFLDLEIYEGFIPNCKKIIYDNPNKSRYNINWTDNQIKRVNDLIQQYDFLNGYSYKR